MGERGQLWKRENVEKVEKWNRIKEKAKRKEKVRVEDGMDEVMHALEITGDRPRRPPEQH
jgi:hypothetical protein